jgi:hypothetical protein
MMDRKWLPEDIDMVDLLAVVPLVLGREIAALVQWNCQHLYQPRVDSTKGVYLLTGSALVAQKRTPWSVVLKILAAPPDGSLPFEAALYRSGWLGSLQHGLLAPRCFAVVDLPGGATGVWLEYVQDAEGGNWTQSRFALAATHLGVFSAVQTLQGMLPAWPVLRRIDWHGLIVGCGESIAQLRELRGHPLVRRAVPDRLADGFLQLWEMRSPLLQALEQTTNVVSHGDAQRRNLFAGYDTRGDPCTVAIDWANTSLRPHGADIGTLIHQSLMYFDTDVSSVVELDRIIFTHYLSGLSQAGWRGDRQEVRFAYTTQLALGLGLIELGWVLRLATDENRQRRAEVIFGRSLAQILDRRAAIGHWLITLADEAYACVHATS